MRQCLVATLAIAAQIQPFTALAIKGHLTTARSLVLALDSQSDYNAVLVAMKAIQDVAQKKSWPHAAMCEHGWARLN